MFSAKRWFAVLMPAALTLWPSAGQAQQGGFRPVLPGRPAQAQPPANPSPSVIGSPRSAQAVSSVMPRINALPPSPNLAQQQQQLLAAQHLPGITQPLTPFQQQLTALQLSSGALQQQNLLQQQQLAGFQLQNQFLNSNVQQPNLLAQPNPLQQPNPLLQPNFFQQPNLFQQANPFQQP